MPATVIDLFCGAGGLSLGFEQAGFRVLAGFDSDARALASYSRNFPNSTVSTVDIGKNAGSTLLELAGATTCDVLTGGPPCQAFSLIGKRHAGDARRSLVQEFARLVTEIRPKMFVMENVPGILLPEFEDVLDAFHETVGEAGYTVSAPWRLNAADFGVPQNRRRVFFIGARSPYKIPTPPAPSGPPPSTADAIGDLAGLNGRLCPASGQYLGHLPPATNRYARVLRGDEPDPEDLSVKRATPVGLSGCAQVIHTAEVTKRFKATPCGSREPVSRFERLHPDRLAGTIRAGTDLANGKHTAARPIHYAKPRCLTVREAARLQSFPDWFEVDSTKWRGFMQVGNAVPPLFARAVACTVRDELNSRRGGALSHA